jgi:hypothetical protein
LICFIDDCPVRVSRPALAKVAGISSSACPLEGSPAPAERVAGIADGGKRGAEAATNWKRDVVGFVGRTRTFESGIVGFAMDARAPDSGIARFIRDDPVSEGDIVGFVVDARVFECGPMDFVGEGSGVFHHGVVVELTGPSSAKTGTHRLTSSIILWV